MVVKTVSLAGVDPSGGAGLLADLKAFSALGAYGMGVVTALTAQNTCGVTASQPVSGEFIRAQWDTLTHDITPDAVKVGMLANSDVATVVEEILTSLNSDQFSVVDPVMVATSGDSLVDREALGVLRDILPYANLITPNVPEAATLLGTEPARTVDDLRKQAEQLLNAGAQRVLVKAGHLETQEATDVYADSEGFQLFSSPRWNTQNTHGTGCTLSSAIAALRPQTRTWAEAIQQGKNYTSQAIAHADALGIGHGHGPTHHFWRQWQ